MEQTYIFLFPADVCLALNLCDEIVDLPKRGEEKERNHLLDIAINYSTNYQTYTNKNERTLFFTVVPQI